MLHVPYKDYFKSSGDIDMLGSIKGLVCLFHYKLDRFLLWNPAIRQVMKIDSPIRQFNLGDAIIERLGFCWDALENDFKVVYSYYKTGYITSPLSLYIYSCNFGSWSLQPNFMFSGPGLSVRVPSVIVNGMPYWNYNAVSYWNSTVSSRPDHINMVKFDVRSKEFRSLPELEVASGQDYVVVNFKECLYVLAYIPQSSSDSLVDVHCFDEKHGVWSMMYNIVGSIFGRVLGCFKYGGEIVFVADGIFRCYDHKTNKIRDLDNQKGWIRKCFDYTESLIFLEGMKPQHQLEPGLWK